MMRHLESTLALLCAGIFVGGCVCPPCAAGAAAAPGAPAAAGSSPSVAADGMMWNGDGVGNSAKGWASCDKKPECKSEVKPMPGSGNNGSTGLKFEGEGAGFVGMGWNWFGWWPQDGGTDLSAYKQLTFSIKVDGASPELTPEASAVTFALGSSTKKDSGAVPLSDYDKNAIDGKWHKITIPISDFKKGEGKNLAVTSVWEFRISTWSASPRKFEIYVDDIGFEK